MPECFFQALHVCSHGDVHGTLSGEYLGDRGEYKGKDRSKVAEREKETYWNCFLTKFFLASKSQAPIFLNYMSTPLKKETPFFVW